MAKKKGEEEKSQLEEISEDDFLLKFVEAQREMKKELKELESQHLEELRTFTAQYENLTEVMEEIVNYKSLGREVKYYFNKETEDFEYVLSKKRKIGFGIGDKKED